MKDILSQKEITTIDGGRKSYCFRYQTNNLDLFIKTGDKTNPYSLNLDLLCFHDPIQLLPSPKRHDNEQKRYTKLYQKGFPTPKPFTHNRSGYVITDFINTQNLRTSDTSPEFTSKHFKQAMQSLAHLHYDLATYHGDPNPSNILLCPQDSIQDNSQSIYWIDFETNASKNASLEQMAARDLRIFLTAAYYKTADQDLIFDCLDSYTHHSTPKFSGKIKDTLCCSLNNAKNPELLNHYDIIGFGNPMNLRRILF